MGINATLSPWPQIRSDEGRGEGFGPEGMERPLGAQLCQGRGWGCEGLGVS